MMAERGFEVDHSSVHRWVIKLVPLFEKAFRRHNRPVGKSWRMDETYVKVARPVEVLVSRSGQGR
jgi:transposase-like protein